MTAFLRLRPAALASGLLILAGALPAAAVTPAVSTSDQNSLFLSNDGTLWGTGNNRNGELGDGSTALHPVPVRVMSGIVQMKSQGSSSLFLRADGTLWAAGSEAFGQYGGGLGNSTHATPVLIQDGVRSFAASGSSLFCIKTDGTLVAAGYNWRYQLGVGPQPGSVGFQTVMTGVKEVAAAYSHTLFLKEDGTVLAAGENSFGQFGTPVSFDSVATPVPVMAGVARVFCNDGGSFFLKNDGTLMAAGYDEYGALGTGGSTQGAPAVPVLNVPPGCTVSSDFNQTLFLAPDGSLWATGHNESGQLGDGTTTDRKVPGLIMQDVQAVDTSGSSTLILKKDGTVLATGLRSKGQLGDGTIDGASLTPQVIMQGIASISAGKNTSNFVTATGDGLLAGATRTNAIYATPQKVIGDVRLSATGDHYSLYLKNDGTVWGYEAPLSNSNELVQLGAGAVQISASAYYGVYLDGDGTAWGLGNNGVGQLGDGSTHTASLPVKIMTGLRSATAALSTTYLVKKDGTLWGSGAGLAGTFGIPSSTRPVSPIFLTTGVSSVAGLAGTYDNVSHAFFLMEDHTLLTVGSNHYGEAGNGSKGGQYTTPQPVPISDVQAVAVGTDFSLFLKTDGTVWASGSNRDGQFGDGTTTDRIMPVQIMSGVKAIAAGANHSLFLKEDGTALATGNNQYGQLGRSPILPTPTPVLQLNTPAPVWQQQVFGAQAADPEVSGWEADPDGDGLSNLLERAFHLSPLTADAAPMPATSGAGGLPRVTVSISPTQGPLLSLQYVRRKAQWQDSPQYFPEVSSTLAPDAWTALTGATTVTSLDGEWERVLITEPAVSGQTARFARVRVVAPAPPAAIPAN
ncbi:MAG: repeat domain protein [Akkermansiaceae bacterium]|nr:repeat domain protein [Akkermansiaceae bacterium]